MKALLGTLLSFVLFASECFALKGGPPYPGGTFATSGTFAGVMTPNPIESPGANSLGLFSVVFPAGGLGTGTLLIFQTGQIYTGTIQGFINPKNAVISGVLNASFPVIDLGTGETFSAVAAGQLNAKVTTNSRILGTADVQFSLNVNQVDSEIIYDVFGFKQA